MIQLFSKKNKIDKKKKRILLYLFHYYPYKSTKNIIENNEKQSRLSQGSNQIQYCATTRTIVV